MICPDTIARVDGSTSKLRRVGLAYLWSILILVGFSPVFALNDRVLLVHSGQHVNFGGLLLVWGAWSLTTALLAPPIFYVVRRYPMSDGGIARIAGYILGSIPFLLTVAIIRWIILPPWNEEAQHFTPRTVQALVQNLQLFAFRIWDYAVVLVAAHGYWYFHRAREQDLERAELEQALAKSELESLKSQLHPHFLFNTMHDISTLMDDDAPQAKAMLLRLSSLLRTALERSNVDLISLEDELHFIKTYLALQRMRFEDRLSVRWDISQEVHRALVPQMILQPLVENAIVHGVACCREGGWVEVSSRRVGDFLELSVRNTVCTGGRPGTGTGIANTQSRLKYLYSDQATFSFAIDQTSVATSILRIPFVLAADQQTGASGVGQERTA